jgi:phage head maturation protease
MSTLKFRPDVDEDLKNEALKVEQSMTDPRIASRNFSSFGARKVDETSSGPVLEFIAVSEGKKRDGSTIRVKGIDLTAIKQNPIWMWGHQYNMPPIGRIVDFRKGTVDNLGKVLKIRVAPLKSTMDTEHKRFADSVFDMYLQGDLRTVSFGWRTVEAEPLKDAEGYMTGWDFVRTDAMEVSAVPVPADPDALITSIRERGLNAERFVTRKPGALVYEVREAIPEEFAAEARDFSAKDEEVEATEVPVTEQRATEAKIEAPKTFSEEDVRKLVEADVRKLLEEHAARLEKRIDEIPLGENRKGAVLNASNRKALTDAMQLIAAVLRNAGPAEADGQADTGQSSAKPEAVRTETPVEAEVKFEDIADIQNALKARRAAREEQSLAASLLGELSLKRKK